MRSSGRRPAGALALAVAVLAVAGGCTLADPILPTPSAGPAVVTGTVALEAPPYDQLPGGRLFFERIGANGFELVQLNAAARTIFSQALSPSRGGTTVAPDGLSVAYMRYADVSAAYDLYVSRADGQGELRLVSLPGNVEGGLGWSQDGSRIGWITANPSAVRDQKPQVSAPDPRLWWQPSAADTTCRALDVRDGPVHQSATAGALFTCGNRRVLHVRTPGAAPRILYVSPGTAAAPVAVKGPTWSPDGALVAFLEEESRSSDQRIRKTTLRVMNADGSNVRTVAEVVPNNIATPYQGPALTNSPALCWLPGGQRLAFTAYTDDQQAHLFVAGLDGTPATAVTRAGRIADLSLSCLR